MSTDGEEEVLDQEPTNSEENADTSSENEVDSDDDTTDERKNQSNWKKMSETKKALERDLRSEREEKAQLTSELKELKDWANSLYEDDAQKPFTKQEEQVIDSKADKLESKIFLLENKEAKEHMDDIQTVRAKYNMDFDEAWTLVQAKLPPESKTKKDFDVARQTPRLPKDLTKVSPEDALSLSKEDQTKWRKANGWE